MSVDQPAKCAEFSLYGSIRRKGEGSQEQDDIVELDSDAGNCGKLSEVKSILKNRVFEQSCDSEPESSLRGTFVSFLVCVNSAFLT